MSNKSPRIALTQRESEVVQHVVEGLPYVEIAEAMKIGFETVKTFMRRIRKKTGLTSRAEITAWALRHKIARI